MRKVGYTSNPIMFVDPDGRWVGQLIGQMLIGAAMSTAQYAISSGGNITGDGLVYSALSGAAGGALSYGTTQLLGNVLTLSPAANAVLEPLMRGTGTFLVDAAAQGIAYGKVDWNQALIRGGVATAYSAIDVAMNGALINPMRDFKSVEGEMNTRLSAGHEKYHSKMDVDISKDKAIHRIGGIKANYYASAEANNGRAYPSHSYKGGDTRIASGSWHARQDYRDTFLHEIYHTYTAQYNEGECDNFAAEIMQLLQK